MNKKGFVIAEGVSMDKHHEWISKVYDDRIFGSCGLCEIDEDISVSSDSEHVLCPVCGFCLKYHCDCEAL